MLSSGRAGILPFPTDRQIRRFTLLANRQLVPANPERPPAGTPLRAGGPIKHVFFIIRENRTYDQVLGDDRRGDGAPALTLFGQQVTPNMHALVRRFPLLDHVYANSEASIDGHFWTSAAAVSDYVQKNWEQNYAGRNRPYDFGAYTISWPGTGFLFDRAQRQAHLVLQLRRGGRRHGAAEHPQGGRGDGQGHRPRSGQARDREVRPFKPRVSVRLLPERSLDRH